MFQTSMLTLQVANCLTSLELKTGQKLFVPTVNPAATSSSFIPPEGCDNPLIRIYAPFGGQTITDGFEVTGVVDPKDFGYYELQVRHTGGAADFHSVLNSNLRVGDGNRIGFLNFRNDYIDGLYWLKLVVYDSDNGVAGTCAIQVNFDVK